MSDKTPRTNALPNATVIVGQLFDLCRTLETELTSAKAEIERLERELALAKSSQSLTSLR